MEQDLTEVEQLRRDLAEFFCEDIVGFKLEECFKIFHAFLARYVKAVEVRLYELYIYNLDATNELSV